MAKEKHIKLFLDGKLVYCRKATKDYAFALVGKGFGRLRAADHWRLRILRCGNDHKTLSDVRRQKWVYGGALAIVVPIVNREVRVLSEQLRVFEQPNGGAA